MSRGPSVQATSVQLLVGPRLPAPRPGAEWMWEQVFPGRLDQLGRVRSAVRALLDGCPAMDEIVLLLSELAANAVLHSRSGEPGGTFTVRLSHAAGDCAWGEVEDGGSSWSGDLHVSARDRSGLFLLLTLASECGVSGEAAERRVVWFCRDCRPEPMTGEPADDR